MALVVMLGGGGLLLWKRAHPSKPAVAVLPQPPLPPPQVKTPKSLDDLAAGRFAVQRERGGTNSIISGDVHNVSGNLHRNVTAHLDLLDAQAQKIGELHETIVELSPKTIWRVITRTGDTNVVSARVNHFTEKP